jgi:hypothetical protein
VVDVLEPVDDVLVVAPPTPVVAVVVAPVVAAPSSDELPQAIPEIMPARAAAVAKPSAILPIVMSSLGSPARSVRRRTPCVRGESRAQSACRLLAARHPRLARGSRAARDATSELRRGRSLGNAPS